MNIFNFFKKVIKKENFKEVDKEKLNFSEIKIWIDKKKDEKSIKEEKIFFLVNDRINLFINEFKNKIIILENVNIDLKKVEDNIKFVVNESRKKYIESSENFIKNLNNLNNNKLEEFVNNINKSFLDFNKNSHIYYEKVTILIGKEMADINGVLKLFSKELIKIFDENKNIIHFSETVFFIESKLKQINIIKNSLEEINQKIILLNKKIEFKKDEKEKVSKEIEKIKKSKEYIENLERKEKINLFKKELEKDIFNLKQIIDFKSLTNFFHIFKEQMNFLKDYKENFLENFQKDNGINLLKLLNESNLNNELIFKKIKQINNKKEEIEKEKEKIEEDKTFELDLRIRNVLLKINELGDEKLKEEKRKIKFNENNKYLTDLLNKKFEKNNIELIFDK